MFFIFRTITRGGSRRTQQTSQKPAGPPMTGAGWVLVVVFLVAGAALTALFKHGHTANGVAFLEAFGVLVLAVFLVAGLFGGGGNKGPKVPADELREAVQQAANKDR